MKRKQNFIMQNVGGENILVPLGAQVIDLNGLITLNETAAYIWELLAEEHTFEELVRAVINEFNVDSKAADRDIKAFIEEINKIGILDQ